VEGASQQDKILKQAGKLTQEEADKCLENSSDAIFPVGEDAVILIYAVRNFCGNQRERESENVGKGFRPPIAQAPPIIKNTENRDTGAMNLDNWDSESESDCEKDN